MSFTTEIKTELLNLPLVNDCCILARLSACISTIGSIEPSPLGITFSLRSDNTKLLKNVQEIINKVYSEKIETAVLSTEVVGKHTMYEMQVPRSLGQQILKDCGIIYIGENNSINLNFGIDHHIIMADCCKKTYLQTVLITVGQVSLPTKTSGYHFELELTSNEEAKAVSSLLGEFGFFARKVERGGKFLVYLKEGEAIADLLAFLGATKSYLKLTDEIVKRDMRNSINRQSNCNMANINKTVSSALNQVKAIENIIETVGLDSLSDKLKQTAELRLNNPELSLNELVELCEGKFTKSGLNYNLNKLLEISKNL